MKPLVSIIIPVYNAEKYLAACIESVISQTWPNLEIIIVDDGSKDQSLKVAQRYSGEKIKVINKENQGASIARNTGLKAAQGEYIQFLDADDILSANKIADQMKILNGSKNHLALCKTAHFYDGDDHLKSVATNDWYNVDSDDPVDFLIKLYAGWEIMPGYGGMIQPNAWLTPMELIKKAGMWNEFRCPDDDGEFFCRVVLASEGIKFSHLGLNYYRKFREGNSLSGQKSLQAFENIILSIDLKYKNLKARTADSIIDNIFARSYWEIGVAAYPQYKILSNKTIKKAKALNYKGPQYKSGKVSTYLSKLVGWRTVRLLSYLRYGF